LHAGMRLSVSDLTSRLQDFAKTGDLSAVGELRYVLAHRVDGKTAVLTMWTEGPTPLLKMFPTSGDAPGRDPQEVPRAPGTGNRFRRQAHYGSDRSQEQSDARCPHWY
jgi:hypothetical protein